MSAKRNDWHVNYQMLTKLGRQVLQVWFVSRWEVGGHRQKGRKLQEPFSPPVMNLEANFIFVFLLLYIFYIFCNEPAFLL